MSKKFNLNDSLKSKKQLNNSESPTLDKLMIDVQKDEVELARINFEIDKKIRQNFKAKTSTEGKQMREVLIKLIQNYLNS
jgi:hypothetical protein